MDWLNFRILYITSISFFWIGYIFLYHRSGNRIAESPLFGFIQSIIALLPIIIITGFASFIYTDFNGDVINFRHFIFVLILYPLWGIIQQYIMLEVVFKLVERLYGGKASYYTLMFSVSALFSIIHYPSTFLMIFTFCLEVLFIHIYFRWHNLTAIGIAHGWIATFVLFFVMERDLWMELIFRN